MNKEIDAALVEILACPDCVSGVELKNPGSLKCLGCGRNFKIQNGGIAQMLPSESKPLPDIFRNPDFLKFQEHAQDALSEYFQKGVLFNMIHVSAHRNIGSFSVSRREGMTLDIGCGVGAHFAYMDNVADVIGLDLSSDMLLKLNETYPSAKLVQGDSYRLPFKSGSAGKVVSVYTLEHLYHIDDAVEEMHRVISDDGRLFVGLPCEGGWMWNGGRYLTSRRTLSKKYKLDYRQAVAALHCNTAMKVMSALEKRFAVEKIRYYPFAFLPSIKMNLTVSLQLRKR